ncbi:MAG: hypothetical protein JXB15_12135 [Anaerolineales bacterium]|nr:hypothetical protein [Anaerolineales bacterium]
MKKPSLLLILCIILLTLACSLSSGDKPEPQATKPEANLPPPPTQAAGALEATLPPAVPEKRLVELRQWAISAEASSQRGEESPYSAMQATGKPNAEGCGESPWAWAPYYDTRDEYLELRYARKVIPTQINIYLNLDPSAVSEVWVFAEPGGTTTVYEAEPQQTACPYVLRIDLQGVDYQADTLRVYLGQEKYGKLNQVDAVELVGLVEGEAGLEPTAALERTPPPGLTPAPTKGGEPTIIAPMEGGGAKFDPAEWSFTSFNTSNGLPENLIKDVAVGLDGVLWVATGNKGVMSFDGNVWKSYTPEEGPQVNYANAIAVAPDGAIWFAGYGLARYDGSSVTKYLAEDGLLDNAPKAMAFAPDGSLWVANASGVSHLEGSQWTTYPKSTGIPESNIEDIAIAPDGGIWLATGAGAARFDGGAWKVYTKADGLSMDGLYEVEIAADGKLWIGTGGQGALRFDGGSFSLFRDEGGLSMWYVNDITLAPDDGLWFAATGYGVYRFDGINWLHFSTAEGLVSDWVDAIAVAPDGTIWFATRDAGISRLAKK